MRRLVPSIIPLVPVLLLAACTDARQPTAPGDARREELGAPGANGHLGDSLSWITPGEAHAFSHGKYLFQKLATQLKGLGPTFNARSCAECHSGVDGVFGSPSDRVETHFTGRNADGSCSSLAAYGGFVRQDSATTRLNQYFTTEPFPPVPHDTARRITPDLFGFGLIAAIPDTAILALADPDDADGDGISGRAHMVDGVVGRFGRKAAEADLDRFNAGAYLHEMGMTNDLFPEENTVGSWTIGGDSIPATVDPVPDSLELKSGDLADVNAFIRFLAPPPSTAPNTAEELQGQALFTSLGCARCHTPKEYTAVSSTSLNGRKVRPFSDFLLHNMGPQLSDICLLQAGNSEFRTEPLMGARFMTRYLHDGRALTIGQAIYQHDGEAAAARDAFASRTSDERSALIAYIRTL